MPTFNNMGPVLGAADDIAVVAIDRQRRARATQPTGNAVNQVQVGTTDKILGGLNFALPITGMLSFIAMPIALVGSGLNKIGLGFIGKGLQAPSAFLNNASMAEVGRVTGLGAPMGAVAQAAANTVAPVVHGGSGGISGWFRNRHVRAALVHFENAQQGAAAVAGKLDSLPEGLKSHAERVASIISAAPHAGAISMMDLREATGNLAGSRKGIKLPKQMSGVLGQIDKMAVTADRAASHHAAAVAFSDVGGTIRNAPKKIGQAKVGNALFNGSFIAMSGVSMFSDARVFKRNLASLGEMYTAITGEKASTVKLLLGKVPTPVMEARAYLLKNITIKELTDAAGMAVNIKQAVDHHFSGVKAIISFAAPQLIAGGADMLMGDSVLPIFSAFSAAYNSGEPVPAELYTAFVGVASKELRARGGANGQFTKVIGQQYAEEKASPKQILDEVSNGGLMKRIQLLIAADESSKAGEVVSSEAKTISHAERLNGTKEMAVHGQHSKRVASQHVNSEGESPTLSRI